MKRKIELCILVLILCVCLPFLKCNVALADEPTLPDLAPTNLVINPAAETHYGTSVTISAIAFNYGICWITSTHNGDYSRYHFGVSDTPNLAERVNVTIRVRARGGPITGAIVITKDFVLNHTRQFTVAPAEGWVVKSPFIEYVLDVWPAYYLYGKVVAGAGGAGGELDVDYIEIFQRDVSPPTYLHAEIMLSGGLYPDSYTPGDVVLRWFDGATQIGEKTVAVPECLYNNGGRGPFSINWIANTPGTHTISVSIDPDDNVDESDETNNVISASYNVYATLTTASSSGGGTTNPAPGQHNYYGGDVLVSAFPTAAHYYFDHMNVDGSNYYSSEVLLTMDQDHSVTAYFYYSPPHGVGGYYDSIDKFKLLAPGLVLSFVLLAIVSTTALIRRRLDRKKT